MIAERWQAIKRVLDLVGDAAPEDRSRVLAESCGADENLRREVESLLGYEGKAAVLDEAVRILRSGAAGKSNAQISEPTFRLQPGARLGPYEITAPLGAGGMGEVYSARDTRLGRTVAVKILTRSMLGHGGIRTRFEREARAISSLNHPNICTLHDIGQDNAIDYLVMEYLEGRTLAERLKEGNLACEDVLDTAIAIAEALDYAHARGVIHRDVKPGNIMLTDRGAKLLDFGLARWLQDTEEPGMGAPAELASSLTATGSVMGTPHYMAPEQIERRNVDARTDVFALGAVIYEMATGRKAFAGSNRTESTATILAGEPPDHAIPQPPLSIAQKAMRRDPRLRYQSAGEMTVELRGLRKQITSASAKSGNSGLRKLFLSRRVLWTAACVSGLLMALGLNIGRMRERLSTGVPRVRSLAVLPLENLTGDPAQQYFVDGMTEELTTDLAQIAALKVISRSSAMRYKGTRTPLRAAARELNVDAIVEGAVQRTANRVKITAQLIYAPTDAHLWADSYERDIRDVLTLQQEVARDIARGIQVSLTPQEQTRLGGPQAIAPEAYEDFLKGRYYWQRLSVEGYNEGVKYFQQAITKQPNYAEAYVGLAACYLDLGLWEGLPAREARSLGKSAAAKALSIEETLGAAHALLGHIHFLYDWDWQASEREFRRALELNPRDTDTHMFYAIYLAGMDRYQEALAETGKAHELDPVSHVNNMIMGAVYYWGHRFDEAIGQNKKTLALYPDSAISARQLGLSYEAKGMPREALEAYLELGRMTGLSPEELAARRQEFKASGLKGYWREQLTHTVAESKKHGLRPYTLADLYAHLGDKEQALAWLEKAHAEGDHNIAFMKIEPALDGLRSDPRFKDLLRQVGLLP